MKESGTPKLMPQHRRPVLRRTSAGWRVLREWALICAAGFVLSGVRVAGHMTPLAACLAVAIPLGFRSIFAALGAVGGYLLFGEGGTAAELTAMTVLMLASAAVFQGTELPARRWFFPLISGVVAGVLGAVFFFSAPGGDALLTLLFKVCLSACGTAGLRGAAQKSRGGRVFLTAALTTGLSGIPTPVDLGLLAAAALCVRLPEMGTVLACGLALELSGEYGGCAAAALLLPVLLCRMLRLRRPVRRAPVCFCVTFGMLLLCGAGTAERLLGAAIGCMTGVLLTRIPFARLAADPQETAAASLNEAAEILEALHAQVEHGQPPRAAQSEADSVYDGAAERVCRCCARFHRCWEHCAEWTYHALTGAGNRIMERGIAQAEDFPPEFRENCCHFDGFLTAVNQELEGMLYRRRYRIQLAEARQTVADEFSCIAGFLRDMQELPQNAAGAYRPVTGISTARKPGNLANGDRGACFFGPRTEYYILLCDGMGSGREAAALSSETVHFLKKLLFAGMDAENALRVLNGAFLLRGDGCFATVDLLRIDLSCGDALLLKWGGAPAYLRKNEKEVKKMGAAALPPGVGGDHAPEQYRLSLRDGEMLILLSDGAGGEETEELIAGYTGESPRELAALLIAGAEAMDDMTAVAVSLRPQSS